MAGLFFGLQAFPSSAAANWKRLRRRTLAALH